MVALPLQNIKAVAAFQDFLHQYSRKIEKENIRELIMMRAKTPKIWEAAMWKKFTEECLTKASEKMAEELLDE